ncbi:MAG: hypothetical protein GKR89_23625 [Candidatus Latescibacteria bacterium]|nr:hypothetical protein [Candidatus Latescibacterota bacterium]
MAKALLRHGANPNHQCSHQGYTILHRVLQANVDVEAHLQFLLAHGADPTISDNRGQMPLEFALQDGKKKQSAFFVRNPPSRRSVGPTGFSFIHLRGEES